MQALAGAPEAAQPGLDEELRGLALISLGIAKGWAARAVQAEPHLEQGVALTRRIGRPYLEFTGLAYQATVEFYRSFPRAAERSRQAIELAERHGWTDDPFAGIAYMALGGVLAWQGRLDEAEAWVQRAERTVRAEADPAAALRVQYFRGMLELGRGRAADALAAFRSAERLAGRMAVPYPLAGQIRAWLVHVLVRLGDTRRAEQAPADLGEHDRDLWEMRIAAAVLRLAQHDPHAAAAALAPVLDGSAAVPLETWLGWGVPGGGDRPGRARRPGR